MRAWFLETIVVFVAAFNLFLRNLCFSKDNLANNWLPLLGLPKPEFRSLAQDASWRHFEDPNPVAAKVARLIDGYAKQFPRTSPAAGSNRTRHPSHKAALAHSGSRDAPHTGGDLRNSRSGPCHPMKPKYATSEVRQRIPGQPLPHRRGSDPSRERQRAISRNVSELLKRRTY